MFKIFKKFLRFLKNKRFYRKNGFELDDFRKLVESQKFMESCPRSTLSLTEYIKGM